MSVFTSVIKVLSGFVAGLLAARKSKSRGWLWGMCGGAVYALMAFVIFSYHCGALVQLLCGAAVGCGDVRRCGSAGGHGEADAQIVLVQHLVLMYNVRNR